MAELTIAEKILKRKQDPRLQEQLQAEQVEYEPRADKEIDDALKNSKFEKEKKEQKKKLFKLGGIGVGGIFLVWFASWLMAPFMGGPWLGACRTYLELNLQYPSTLELYSAQEFSNYITIWFTHTDGFGSYRMDSIKCVYEPDDYVGWKVKEIAINRTPVAAEKIEAFNKILPTVYNSGVDLTYPRPLFDALGNINIETYLLRKPIL